MSEKEKKRKFLEVLQEMDPNTVIKVGAKDGSSFFYIGFAGYMLDHISDISGQILTDWRRLLKNAESKAFSTAGNLITYQEYCQRQILKMTRDYSFKPVFKYAEYLDMLDKYSRILDTNIKNCNRIHGIIASFQFLDKRYVADCFKADPVVDDTTVVIVDGKESGAYWKASEIEPGTNNLKLHSDNTTPQDADDDTEDAAENE